MKRTHWLLLPLVALACFDGPSEVEEGITMAELAGTWDATAIQVTNNLEPTLQEDLFALGVRWRMVVAVEGTFRVDFANPVGADGYGGSLDILGDSLILTSAETSPARQAMHYVYDEGVLGLTWLGEEQCGSYGWTAEECPIPATFEMSALKVIVSLAGEPR
jgi:hypothetical protein